MSDPHSTTTSFEVQSGSETDTIQLARELAEHLKPGDVVALIGELGAGKTRFVRGLVEGLGLDASCVTSPTFVLLQEYSSPDSSVTFAHIDAYRLASADELDTIGWDELITDPNVIVAIEWSERIESRLPENHLVITINHDEGDQRTITVTPRGPDSATRDWRPALAVDESTTVKRPATRCPICSASTDPKDAAFPFCSNRCRMIDLGRWLGGKYTVSRELEPDDADNPELT